MSSGDDVHPMSGYEGSSVGREVISRSGIAQYRRNFEVDNPTAHVLMLHGIAEHSGRYEHIGATFAEAGFAVQTYDHYGHGRSGGVRGHIPSFDTFLDDVEDNLAELAESGLPVILFAHSMGGLIATAYAVSDRPQPDVLLLSGPALGAEVPKWQSVGAPIIGRVAPKLFIKNEFDGSLLCANPAVWKQYEQDPLRVAGATAGLGLALFQAMEETNSKLSKISVPTLVLHGEKDRIVAVHFSEPMSAVPSVTRKTLPGLEHEILNESSWKETMATYIAFATGAIALA